METKDAKYVGRRSVLIFNTSAYVNIPPSWRDARFVDVFEVDDSTLLIKKVGEVGV